MNSLIDLLQQEILIIPDINGDGLAHRETPRPPLDWLHHWLQTTCGAPDTPQVPPEACAVTTPLVLSAWRHMLISHPHRSLVHFFLQGIATGFKVGYDYTSTALKSAKRNMNSASEHMEVVTQYLASEMSEGRVVGPFPPHMVPNTHISRFGVIPKSHQPNKWRLIVDLSHPKGKSVNDGIRKDLCSMSYISVDDAIRQIITLGQGTLLAKIDIKSAFRLICVHPADRHLLAMEWQSTVYIDTCLPFGLRYAPKLFNILADLLEWILLNQGVTFLMHYLDDFPNHGGARNISLPTQPALAH